MMTPPFPHVGRLVRRAQQVHNRLWNVLVSDEVTAPQFAVLLALGSHPDADQGTIGRAASLDRSTVADVVERMGRRGYLERHRDPKDQRRNVLRLSETGRVLLDQLSGRARAMNQQLLGVFDDAGREEFLRQLATFVARVEAMANLRGELGEGEPIDTDGAIR
jgi:MarR family transcriptional regulator, temperature-dependent positive regulator of motility